MSALIDDLNLLLRESDIKVTWLSDDSQHFITANKLICAKVGISFRYILHTFFSNMLFENL